MYGIFGTELGEIVDMFAQETSDRVAALLGRLEAPDWEGLRGAAHQLRGAGAGYGLEAGRGPSW